MIKRFFKLTAIVFISPALLNLSVSSPVKAENQFDVCLREIVKSGVNVGQAGTACADALIPKELSYCVQKISNNTAIKAEDALTNCYQVRRPVDMANCVVNIDKTVLIASSKTNSKTETTTEKTEENTANTETIETTTEVIETTEETEKSPLILALETCRTSLSPSRHSECVVALSRTPQAMSAIKAMENCINAEDFPKDLFPDN